MANPYLTRAGDLSRPSTSANVTGLASDSGPHPASILSFIRQVLPRARRVGTLWTPSELNSEYYLELARPPRRSSASRSSPCRVANASEVLLAAQVLINKKIDVIYQISDNTINNSFELIGRIAEENAIPLVGGFLLSTRAGACAAMGWDFFDMGMRTGQIVLRVKNGESPAAIPFQGYVRRQALAEPDRGRTAGREVSGRRPEAGQRNPGLAGEDHPPPSRPHGFRMACAVKSVASSQALTSAFPRAR